MRERVLSSEPDNGKNQRKLYLRGGVGNRARVVEGD